MSKVWPVPSCGSWTTRVRPGYPATAEVWQTEQTFRAYLDYRLRPALRMHGVHREPLVEVTPLHNVYAPEIFTIERMGSVSLPAHATGARF